MITNFTNQKERTGPGLTGWVFSLLFLFIFSGTLQAQNVVITGTIKDSRGEPLIGASVGVLGTKNAVSADQLGRFSLRAPSNATLEVTYVGFIRREIAVNSRTAIDIVLQEDSRQLEEFVVMGYGLIEKSDVTGSISSAKLKDVNESKAVSLTEALQGKVSGVNIVTNTGEPGGAITFNIRGMTSVTGSNQPLIVIDGQPIESSFGATYAGQGLDGGADIPPADPLASINPNDIESIEILKDASSTAIYGSRGANGVVLITTKSGAAGRDRLSFSSRVDLSNLPKQLNMLSSYEYIMMKNEAAVNDATAPVYTAKQLDSVSKTININWQDVVYQTAVAQDYQMSFSGREKSFNYLLSGNFSDQQSIIPKAGFKRAGIRLNFSKEISRKLSVGLRTYLSTADRKFGLQSNWTGILGSSVVMGALSFNPLQNPYDPETGDIDEDLANGPLLLIDKVTDRTRMNTIISNFNADYKISKSLTYNFKAGINQIYSLRNIYYPTGTFIGNSAPGGSATRADNSNSNYLIDNLLSFRKTYDRRHSINAVGGFSFQSWTNNSTSVTNLGFPSNTLTYNNLQGAQFPGRTYYNLNERSLASVLGRINYAFDRRYVLTLTGRYDGSTRLAEGNKWQFYPSAGLAWNVSNEDFFKGNKLISMLKVRTSVGVAGNDNVSVGGSQASYGINFIPFGSTINPSYVMNNFENPDLGWETTTKYNAGVDFGFLKDRLTLSLDYYKHITTDLLINLALPGSAGIGSYFTNVGKIMNQGLDIEATYNVRKGKASFDFGANFSTFNNRIENLGEGSVIYGRGFFAGGAIALNQPVTAAFVGQPISSFFGYKTNGVYQNQNEINSDPAVANDAARSAIQPGMIKYIDINGDGQITGEDKTMIGNPSPDFTYGFNSNVTYNRFSASIVIFGSHGGELLNLNRWMVGSNHANTTYNSFQDTYDGRWRGEGTSNLYPKLTISTNRLQQRLPDWMAEDASFIRLQNLTLGYSFQLPKQWNMGSLKTFVTGTNLFTITKYSGYDPNVNSFGQNSLNAGLDLGTMPQARSFSAGLTLSF